MTVQAHHPNFSTHLHTGQPVVQPISQFPMPYFSAQFPSALPGIQSGALSTTVQQDLQPQTFHHASMHSMHFSAAAVQPLFAAPAFPHYAGNIYSSWQAGLAPETLYSTFAPAEVQNPSASTLPAMSPLFDAREPVPNPRAKNPVPSLGSAAAFSREIAPQPEAEAGRPAAVGFADEGPKQSRRQLQYDSPLLACFQPPAAAAAAAAPAATASPRAAGRFSLLSSPPQGATAPSAPPPPMQVPASLPAAAASPPRHIAHAAAGPRPLNVARRIRARGLVPHRGNFLAVQGQPIRARAARGVGAGAGARIQSESARRFDSFTV